MDTSAIYGAHSTHDQTCHLQGLAYNGTHISREPGKPYRPADQNLHFNGKNARAYPPEYTYTFVSMGGMQQQAHSLEPYNVGNSTAYGAHFACNNTYQGENAGYNGAYTHNEWEDDIGYGNNTSETKKDSKYRRKESVGNDTVDTFGDIGHSQDTTMDTKRTINADNTDYNPLDTKIQMGNTSLGNDGLDNVMVSNYSDYTTDNSGNNGYKEDHLERESDNKNSGSFDQEENSEDNGHGKDQVTSTATNDEGILSVCSSVIYDAITSLQRAAKKERKSRLQEDRAHAVSELQISGLTNKNVLYGTGTTQTAVEETVPPGNANKRTKRERRSQRRTMRKLEPRRKPKQTEEETAKPKEKQPWKAASQSDTTTGETANSKKVFPAEKAKRKTDPIRRQRIDPFLQINNCPSKTQTKSTEKYLCREWRDRLYRKTVKDKRPTRTAPAQ